MDWIDAAGGRKDKQKISRRKDKQKKGRKKDKRKRLADRREIGAGIGV
jgi:hypothetical protein